MKMASPEGTLSNISPPTNSTPANPPSRPSVSILSNRWEKVVIHLTLHYTKPLNFQVMLMLRNKGENSLDAVCV